MPYDSSEMRLERCRITPVLEPVVPQCSLTHKKKAPGCQEMRKRAAVIEDQIHLLGRRVIEAPPYIQEKARYTAQIQNALL